MMQCYRVCPFKLWGFEAGRGHIKFQTGSQPFKAKLNDSTRRKSKNIYVYTLPTRLPFFPYCRKPLTGYCCHCPLCSLALVTDRYKMPLSKIKGNASNNCLSACDHALIIPNAVSVIVWQRRNNNINGKYYYVTLLLTFVIIISNSFSLCRQAK